MTVAPSPRSWAVVTAITCGLTLVACGPSNEDPPPDPAEPQNETPEPETSASPAPESSEPTDGLAGTSWRLVEIQSMDDAIGASRPDDPTLYTLGFGDDGTVQMRLNCNRGTGPWSASPGESGSTGSLTIGPLAVTRAMCPPPTLDQRIARDMDAVRTFMLRDGRLSLSLMADAGIYIWEPDPAADEAEEANEND